MYKSQHLTLSAGPGITPPLYIKYVLTPYMVIVGSILDEDAPAPPLFLSRYVILLINLWIGVFVGEQGLWTCGLGEDRGVGVGRGCFMST